MASLCAYFAIDLANLIRWCHTQVNLSHSYAITPLPSSNIYDADSGK